MSITFWDSHSIKSLLILNDKVFPDFIKKEKTLGGYSFLYLAGSVFGRLTKYIST